MNLLAQNGGTISIYKENIYLTCGQVEGMLSEFCPKYDIGTKTWNRIKFQSDKIRNGSCVLNDKMYIIGGKWKEEYKNDIKMYDFQTEQIISLEPKLNEARASFGIRVYNQSIYVCGGESPDNTQNFSNSTVERFDHREGKWSIIKSVPDINGSCTSAVASDSLYSSENVKGIVQEFDIRSNSWKRIPNMYSNTNYSKRNCLISNGGKLYAISPNHILHFNGSAWEQMLEQKFYDYDLSGVSF